MINLLHIIPQEWWHTSAFIIGNRAALEELKKAIEEALESPSGVGSGEFYPKDREGYSVYIACVSEDEIEGVPLGYTDDATKSIGDTTDIPQWLIDKFIDMDKAKGELTL